MASQHQNAESSGDDSEIVCDTFPAIFMVNGALQSA